MPAMRASPRLHFTDELVDKRAAGQPGKRTCQFEQSILAQSFVSAPGVALEEAVCEQQQAMAFGQLELGDRPLMGAKTEGGACRRFKPLHVVVPVHQNARMSRPDGRTLMGVSVICSACTHGRLRSVT